MRFKPLLLLSALGLLAIGLSYQNCSSSLPADDGDLNNLLSITPTPSAPYAKANGSKGVVTVSADSSVLWEWKTTTPVTSGRSRTYNCTNASYNQTATFDWANGTLSGWQQGTSTDPQRAGCSHEVCFDTADSSECVTVQYSAPQTGGAKANGLAGFVTVRADEPVIWSWVTSSPVQSGQARIYDCKDASFNKTESFTWANGTTSGSQQGSSSDYRRDGCKQEVCFNTAQGPQCVTAVHYMQGATYYAGANDQVGVVLRPAGEPTLWQFNTDTAVVRATSQVTSCNDPSRNAPLMEFDWANGKTSYQQLGTSTDPGRVGCHQEVCFYAGQKRYCVEVIYQ